MVVGLGGDRRSDGGAIGEEVVVSARRVVLVSKEGVLSAGAVDGLRLD